MELHLLFGGPVNWQHNLLGAPVPGHHVGIEDFLGNRATSGQGGIVALGHGANEIQQREQGESWNRDKWIASQSKPATNLISRSSGKGGSAKQWSQQDFDITSLLDHNKQTERLYFTGVPMVDAKPQREHYEDRDPKGQEFDGILSEEEEFTARADASGSNTVKRKRGFPEIARERGARAKSKPGGKGRGGKGLRGRKNNVMETAMECARDKVRLEQEAEELEAKYFSETSKQGKESRASTVLQLAKEVTGGHPFPLSKLTVVRVSACLRATKIQSGDQYLGELRAMHVESGHPVGGTTGQDLQTLPEGFEEGQGSRMQSTRVPVEPHRGRDPVAEPTWAKSSDVAYTCLSLGSRVDAEGDRASGGEDQRCELGKAAEESDFDDKEV